MVADLLEKGAVVSVIVTAFYAILYVMFKLYEIVLLLYLGKRERRKQ